MTAVQNQYATLSEAASVAPIVLWSEHCQGRIYVSGKNTFLEFYTDENKAIKRNACARSASADSVARSSGRTTATPTTATPTNRSSSPSNSNRSLHSRSDSDLTPKAEWQSPGATPRSNSHGDEDVKYWDHDSNNDFVPTAYQAQTYPIDAYPTESYDMQACDMMMVPMMMPMMMPETPNINNTKNGRQSQQRVVNKRVCNERLPAMKQDLKRFNNTAGGSKDATTLMFRGIPCSFSQERLMKIIDNAGLKGKYDFFYLPRADSRGNDRSNLGYAFLNFVDSKSAQLCIETFSGVSLDPARSMKTCTISPGDIQGLSNLRRHFHCTAVSRGPHRPLFLKVNQA